MEHITAKAQPSTASPLSKAVTYTWSPSACPEWALFALIPHQALHLIETHPPRSCLLTQPPKLFPWCVPISRARRFLGNSVPCANVKLSWCLFVWIIYLVGGESSTRLDRCLWEDSPLSTRGASVSAGVAVLSLVLCPSPLVVLAPGGVTNAAFVSRCSSHVQPT